MPDHKQQIGYPWYLASGKSLELIFSDLKSLHFFCSLLLPGCNIMFCALSFSRGSKPYLDMDQYYIWTLMARKLAGEASREDLLELQEMLQDNPHIRYSMEILANLWEANDPDNGGQPSRGLVSGQCSAAASFFPKL